MRKSILLLLIPLLLAGCRKEGFVPYTGLEAGQICDGVITTDGGVRLVIDSNPGNYNITTGRRVLASYKATAAEGDKSYRIDLEELRETSVVEPVPSSEPRGVLSDDPVRIDEAWFSGGYLNVGIAYNGTDPAHHRFPATYEIAEGKVVFRIWHDAWENFPARDPLQRAFLCYPLDSLTKEYMDLNPGAGKKKNPAIPVLLQWRWYAQEGETTQDEIILYEKEGTFLPAS